MLFTPASLRVVMAKADLDKLGTDGMFSRKRPVCPRIFCQSLTPTQTLHPKRAIAAATKPKSVGSRDELQPRVRYLSPQHHL
jgi:hypothetical protein